MTGKKNNIALSIVMLLVMLFVAICCVVPRDEIKTLTFPSDSADYSYENIVEVSGLEQNGNKFKAVNDDPHFLINLDGTPIQALSINVKFSDGEKGDIQLYYANRESGFSESMTIVPIAVSNDEYVFDLSGKDVTNVRFDISNDFIVNDIKTSASQIQLETKKQDISVFRVICAILIPVAIMSALYFTKLTEKIAERLSTAFKKFFKWFKRNKLNVAFSSLVYLGIGLVSAIAEFAYCHLVQRVPNSLGVYFDYYRFLFLFCALTTAFTLYLLRKVAGKKPEYLFLAVLLICGTMLTATLHPSTGEAWDDQIHYQWVVTAPIVTDGSYSVLEKENFNITFKSPTDKYSYKDINDVKRSENSESKNLIIGSDKQSSISLYERLGHLPASIATQIFKVFQATHATQIFFARMANLLVYALAMFFAIKKLKTGKMILSVIALIPTFVFLACNFSYDYWVTAFLTLGFVYFLDEWQHPNQTIETKNLAIMMGSFILGCGPKSIYFMFLLLPLMLKKRKSKNYKKFVTTCIACGGFVVVAFLAVIFLNISSGGDIRGGSDVSTIGQIKFILKNPLEYTKILLSFLSGYIKIENFPTAFTAVAYINTPGAQIGILYTILLFVVSFTDKNEHDLEINNWKTKGSMLLFLFLECALLTTALYVSYNPVASQGIGGVQLRYIFPLLFPVFSVIGTTNIKNNINKKTYNYSIIGISAALFYSYFWTYHMTFFY